MSQSKMAKMSRYLLPLLWPWVRSPLGQPTWGYWCKEWSQCQFMLVSLLKPAIFLQHPPCNKQCLYILSESNSTDIEVEFISRLQLNCWSLFNAGGLAVYHGDNPPDQLGEPQQLALSPAVRSRAQRTCHSSLSAPLWAKEFFSMGILYLSLPEPRRTNLGPRPKPPSQYHSWLIWKTCAYIHIFLCVCGVCWKNNAI